MTYRSLLIPLLALAASVSAQTADAKLEAFFKSYLEEIFQLRPLDVTSLGDHRFDHLLDDISPKARGGWLAHARRTLESLAKRP